MRNRPIMLGLAFAILLGFFSACNPPSGKKKGPTSNQNPSVATTTAQPSVEIAIPVGNSPTKGAGEDALVTIVEFSDFQCPFCNRVNDSLKKVIENYGKEVRITFKHNPLPFHKDAPLAAQAAFAANKQGKFWEMHDTLFANMQNLKREDLIKYAANLGLNADAFARDMDSSEAKDQVKADMDLAVKLGARGTPHFFINGKRLPGALPYEKFKETIDQQITEAKNLVAQGNTPKAAYDLLVKKNFEVEKAPTKQEPDSKTVYKVPVGTSYFKGSADALVTIIEFSEFECPFCSRVNPTIKQILDTYGDQVKIVFKHNPLSFHPNAIPASKAAFAAGEQGKFWEMHDLLFANQKALKRENLEQYAVQLGLDLNRFKADLDSSKYDAVIKADQDLATQFGARGTPGFFINGRNLRGAQPFESFKKIIDEELTKAKALLSNGVAKADVYNKLTEKGLLKVAEQAPQQPAEDSKTVYNMPVGNSYAKGGAEPYVTIIEFSEFQCPFCTRVNPTIKQILDTYGDKVKVVFKHNPLPFHADAPLASQAALSAGAQGKFWEMHDLLFANQKALKRENLEQYAAQIGLDLAQFKSDLDSGKFNADVKADQDLAAKFGAGGTPNFFINGRQLVGAQPFDSFKKVIDEEIAKADALLKTGVARANLYAKLTEKGELQAKKASPKSPEADKTVYQVEVSPADAFKGNPNAPITIVEFSEFQCPFCSRVIPTVDELLKLYPNQIKVVFKHNPLSFHADAPLASQAALAANAQGKFWEMHDLMFANQRALKRENLEQYAQMIALDMARFKADLDTGRFKAQIDVDMALATKLGARGTPAFFINGRKLVGAQPVDAFKAVIDELLKGQAPVVQPTVQPVQVPVQPTVQPVQPIQVQPVQPTVQPVQPIQVQPVQPTVQPVQPTVQPTVQPQTAKANIEIPIGNSPVKGAINALVTIVEFSDFQCPFCGRVVPTVKQILDTYGDKVKFSFKHNPLPFHQDAPLASQAAFAAGLQGKFWEMHDTLFENMRALKRENLEQYAQNIGLDMAKFKIDIDSEAAKAQVKADQELSQKLQANGTPHFFVNGKRVPGALPYENFKTIIDEQIVAAQALVQKGLSYDDAYRTLVNQNYAPEAQQQKPAQPDANAVYKIQPGTSYAKGASEPLVTIIEFSEFQCPFCTRVNPTIKQILDTYGDKVKVVFKHNPLPFHPEAFPAAEAALSAGAQGKFWEMHDLMFANQKALKRENLEQYATQIGLNLDQFKADLDSGKYKAEIQADQALAAQFGARGTPGFFINGRNLRGAQPFDNFKKIIDEEITKAENLLKSGVAKADLYNKLTEKGLLKAAEQAKPQQPAEDNKTVYQVPAGKSFAKGGAEPYVTIVEFSEFQCPFCTRVLPTLKQILDTYGDKVKVVFKHNPLPFHADAPLASEAALAAGAQGKFWEMHDTLFANQKALKRENIDQYAAQIGLDLAQFKADLDSGKFKADIQADQAVAAQFGARGTPNFFINGRQLTGARPFEQFKAVIDEEIVKAENLLKTGVARADLYAQLTKNGLTKAAAPAPQQAPAEDNTVYPTKVNANDAFKGNANAVVTILEFSEFQCPFCSRVNPTIKQILDTYGDKVKVVFKHNPLPFHADAPLASEAALAAGAQGKFWEMHDVLFANQRALKRENLDQYAAQIGLDLAQFKADLDSNKYKAQVDADMAYAKEVGIQGTPSFLINGKKLVGAQPFEGFKAKIDDALKNVK